jgi:hypothetical protein
MAALAAAWEARSAKAAEPYVIAIAIGLGGFLLHPHHLDAAAQPLRFVFDPRVKEVARWTAETIPPDMRGWIGILIEIPAAVMIVAAFVAKRRFGLLDALVVIGFGHLALTSVRGLQLYAIAVSGPLATAIDALLEETRLATLLAPVEGAARVFARFAPHALALAFVITAAGRAKNLAPGRPGDMSDPLLAMHAEVAEVASFLKTQPPARIFNGPEPGGALIWCLYPERKVFSDGRTIFHGQTGVFDDVTMLGQLRPGWEQVLDRRGIELVLVERWWNLTRELEARGWRPVYVNKTFGVLARPSR